MTTLRPIHSAPRTTSCVVRVVPATSLVGAGQEPRCAYAGSILAAADWQGLGLGGGKLAEGLGFFSKDMNREVLPT
jgi:hypothetical protein